MPLTLDERSALAAPLGCVGGIEAEEGRTGGTGCVAIVLVFGGSGTGFWGGVVFLTDRIALPVGGLGSFGAEALLEPVPKPVFSNPRIRRASSSLIELLWLFAAIESRSAASSTSLFSRPRSLDSS